MKTFAFLMLSILSSIVYADPNVNVYVGGHAYDVTINGVMRIQGAEVNGVDVDNFKAAHSFVTDPNNYVTSESDPCHAAWIADGNNYVAPGIQVHHTDGTVNSCLPAADTNEARWTALSSAIAGSQRGTHIVCPPGVYHAGPCDVNIPLGVALSGAGKNLTIIKTNSNVYLGDDITNLRIDVNSSKKIIPRESSKVNIYNCQLIGYYDSLYFSEANAVVGAYQSDFLAEWDNILCVASGCSFSGWDCNFAAIYQSGGVDTQHAVMVYGGLSVNLYGCDIKAISSSATPQDVVGIKCGTYTPTPYIQDCNIYIYSTNTPSTLYYDIYNTSTCYALLSSCNGSGANGTILTNGYIVYKDNGPIVQSLNYSSNIYTTYSTFTGGAKIGNLVSGTVDINNIKISASSGQAFVDFNSANTLTGYLGYKLTLTDSSGKNIVGYIKDSGSGETYSSNMLSNYTFNDNTTGWTGSNATLASIAGGQDGNCLEVTKSGVLTAHYAYATPSPTIIDKLINYGAYVKSGTSGDETFYFSDGTNYFRYNGTSTSSWVFHQSYGVGTANTFRLGKAHTTGTILYDEVILRQVLTPSTTGVTIVASSGSADQNWMSADSTFNYNDSSGYTYRIESLFPDVNGLLTIGGGCKGAGSAPIKFTAGSLMTTPEAGSLEYDGNGVYITDINGTRYKLATE